MFKFRVMSGDFQIIVYEKTMSKAGSYAIGIHDQSKHPSLLGELTLVEKLDESSNPTGDHIFIRTTTIIKKQYSRQSNEH